jgi:D-ribose pyranase
MSQGRIINPDINYILTKLGHTQSIVICDAGLPVPKEMEVIDLSLVLGEPSFMTVLSEIIAEGVFEACVYAEELEIHNPKVFKECMKAIGDLNQVTVSHEEFKQRTQEAEVFIRTGEATPYANVILQGGVPF